MTGSDPMAAFTAHLVRIAVWGGLSIGAGLLLRWRTADALRQQAALQCLLWGAINLALAGAGLRGSPPTANFLWLNVGLDAGYAGVGLTLLLAGRRFGSRAMQGAGLAVVPQGVVLAVLDLVYLAALSPRA